MPNGLSGTRETMEFLARQISTNTYVNVMNQYRPCGRAFEQPDVNRSVSREEYALALESARSAGITRLDERAVLRLKLY